MNKCIIFSRVSTEKQTLEQQTELLVNKAKSDGYRKEDIILIEEKESAIKLSANEREGLKKLKKLVFDNEDVDCVYIYEISRLGRRMDVLIEMRDFFVENKIQLFIYNNNQYLLDEKKELTFAGGLIFTLFSQFAESEMKDKKDRMKRGKLHKRSENKYIGGGVAFGYKIDENENIVIDDEQADIVRRVFNDYEKGLSLMTIGKELMKRGEIPSENDGASARLIHVILDRVQYTGVNTGSYVYPQIISKEQFYKCQELKKNKFRPKSNIKHIYWCKNLLTKKTSGRSLYPCIGQMQYMLIDMTRHENASININFMDSLTWHLVKERRMNNSQYDAENDRKDADRRLKDAEKKLSQCDIRIKRLEQEKERVFNLYVKGKINETKYDNEEYRIRCEIADIEIEKDQYNRTITEMMNRIAYSTSFFYEKSFDEPKSDEEISDIIHNDLEKIEIEKTDEKYKYHATYIFKDGMKKELELYRSQKKDSVVDLKTKNEIKFDIITRFERKRY